MDVVVAGGHGKVALALERMLTERGHRARGIVRNPDHATDLERDADLAQHLRGADTVVFAAGAGAGSGAERKRTVDLGGAVKLIAAAQDVGARHYAMVSAIGAAEPEAAPERLRPYLEAKAEADAALARSGLAFTIVRPGRLTNDPGLGRVAAGADVERGDIPREDVAAVLLAVLELGEALAGRTFNVVSGDTPIEEALGSL